MPAHVVGQPVEGPSKIVRVLDEHAAGRLCQLRQATRRVHAQRVFIALELAQLHGILRAAEQRVMARRGHVLTCLHLATACAQPLGVHGVEGDVVAIGLVDGRTEARQHGIG